MAWPSYVGVTSEQWTIAWGTRTSPLTQAGTVQRVASLGDHWTARVTILMRRSDVIKWNSVVVGRRGSLRTRLYGPVLHEVFPVTGTSVTSNTAAGATSITFTVASSSAVPDQCFFGLNDCLYMVEDVTVNSGTSVTVNFFPPLRAAASASDTLDSNPECRMYLENPELASATIGDATEITLSLREAV